MAGERQFEGPAKTHAIDRDGERLAACLQPAIEQRQTPSALENIFVAASSPCSCLALA